MEKDFRKKLLKIIPTMNTNKGPKPQCVQTDVICCDFFKQNIKKYGWLKLHHLGEEKYLTPHISGTKIRINYCPTCGKECRDTVLSADLYHGL